MFPFQSGVAGGASLSVTLAIRGMLSLFRKRAKQAKFSKAISEGNAQRIKELLDDGLDPNFVMRGSSPLCIAVWQFEDWKLPDRSIVDLLIAHRASPIGPGND